MRKNSRWNSNQSKTVFSLTDLLLKNHRLVKERRVTFNPYKLRREDIEAHCLYHTLRFTLLTIFLFGGLGSVKAQTTTPPRQPASSPQTGTSRMPNDSRSIIRGNARETEAAFDELRAMEIPRSAGAINRRSLIEITRNFYRKPNKQEMKVLAPSIDNLNKYALFLRQSGTGIVKLNSDSSCTEGPTIIAAKENCLQYSMPGAGTAYSFRVESHRIPHLADLTLSKNILKSDGVLQYGIMVGLGDIPLEDVTLQSDGLKYLINFEPLPDMESFEALDRQLIKGISADGFTYGISLYVKNQTTFALRSIAYKGKVARSVNGIAYNEMDFDKRRDILVAFRIVEQEANGNITFVWKMLLNKDAPTLKIK
jgi:hypothetical protein